MGFSGIKKNLIRPVIFMIGAMSSIAAFSGGLHAEVAIERATNLGVIRGVVRDDGGSPIADATVAIFRVGTKRLLKQVYSANDGSFLAKVLPGTYSVLAVAEGFNAVTVPSVEVNKADDLVYGFKLERAGSGNTLPEKRLDRNSSKWHIRAAQTQRSIYQNSEGKPPVDETTIAKNDEGSAPDSVDDHADSTRRGQTVVETYFAGSDSGAYQGINFATLLPKTGKADVIIVGQTGFGKAAPQRFETNVKFRASDNHQLRLNTSVGRLGIIRNGYKDDPLGQFSIQGLDEWKVREGVIVVLGVDYSKFVGAGSDFSFAPRLGLQLDIDSKTRFRAAYTTKTEEKTWADAIELEGTSVSFTEPIAVDDLFIEQEGKPQMNKSRRLEFGIERVLDNNSSIEANAFFDATLGRGVGLTSIPFDALSGDNFSGFVSNQTGKTQGLSVVYSRRINGKFSTAAGYSLGKGQKISEEGISNPANLFQDDFFQSFFGQFEADLKTGTSVKTIFRLSPQATVFAIDPFQGRLAIYDPSLSVLVTQSLPNLGLPFHAEAIVDARNLLGFQTGVNGDAGSLRINSQGRMLRGGLLVRF
jgi:hypothetical protein